MSNPFGGSQAGGDKPSTPLFGSNAFGNTNTSGSSNLFAQNPSSSDNSKSLFGGASSAAGGFGSFGQPTQPNATGGGFGAIASSGTSSAPFGSFAAKSDENKQPAASGFAAFATPNKPSLFGNPSQPQSSNIFGNSGANNNAVSQAPSGSATPTTSQPTSLFGNVSTTPAGLPPMKSPPLFSFNQPEKSGQSLFGAPSATQNTNTEPQGAPANSSPFGSKPQTPSISQPASLFGAATSTSQPSTNLFGAATSGSNLFGKPSTEAKNQDSSSGPGAKPTLFGFKPSENQAPATTTSSTTAQNDVAKPDQPSANTPAFSFPALAPSGSKASDASATTAPISSLFTSSASAAKSSNLFGSPADRAAQSNTTPNQTPSLFANLGQKPEARISTAPASNLFPNVGGEKKGDIASSSAPSSNLFASVGQKRDAADPLAKQQTLTSTTTDSSGDAASTSTAAPASSKLFGTSTKPTETLSTAQASTGPAGATTSTTLGSSTTGPAPSAQSRLKNKSMDEIITRWASDLNKYQKDFQTQAQRVAAWDRMLLENGNAISKLYSKTFQAERDVAEVEKQLTAVENDQDELFQWLDRYEREVDEMIARQVGQGEGLQGPDQERERTYKSAERVSERLKEMGKNLTTMIEEINDASASISKTTKADDPLSQVVRILNGHLSQLQLIDQSTAALQTKVSDAQKKGRQLGSRGPNIMGRDAVDDFYRAYMSKG